MSTASVTQILIGGVRVGIIGLNETLKEIAESLRGNSDEEIQEALLSKVSKKNYIPDRARDPYRKALLREYKKFIGDPVPEEETAGLQIKILGPGCPNCDALERAVLVILGELGLPADVEHVRDPVAISEFGVMGTPALVINGKVRSVGKVPSKAALKKMLAENI